MLRHFDFILLIEFNYTKWEYTYDHKRFFYRKIDNYIAMFMISFFLDSDVVSHFYVSKSRMVEKKNKKCRCNDFHLINTFMSI